MNVRTKQEAHGVTTKTAKNGKKQAHNMSKREREKKVFMLRYE